MSMTGGFESRRTNNDLAAFYEHVSRSDLNPHTQYKTVTSSAADLAAHVAAADPHTVYRLKSTQIVTADIASSAITSTLIADGTIATGDIADGAITSAKIADSTIATADIANSAVTNIKTNFTASTYTPVVYSTGISADISVGTGTNAFKQGRYMTLGKLMWIHISVGFGSSASAGSSGYFTFSLPSGITAAATREQVMTGKFYNANGTQHGPALIFASDTVFYIYPDSTPLGPASHGNFGDGYNIFIEGMLEIA